MQSRPRIGRLRWLAIIGPLLFLVALEYVRQQIWYQPLHSPAGEAVVLLLLAAGVASFSFAIFGVIERLEHEIIERNQQLSALNEIGSAAAGKLELNEVLSVTLEKVLQVFRADAGVICLLDRGTDELVAACYRGFSKELEERVRRAPVDADPMGLHVVRTGCPATASRMLEVPELAEIARKDGFRSAISIPLKSEGEVSGVLAVLTRQEHDFSPAEVDLLMSIGAALGLAVRNAFLFTRSQQRNHELTALLAVSAAVAVPLDLEATLRKALSAILEVTSAEVADVWLAGQDGKLRLELRLGDELDAGFESFHALSLGGRNRAIGVLAVAARGREALTEPTEIRLLEAIGEQVGIAVENARLHEQVLDVAVIEERERISRELHDGLAQVLGYINTQAMAIRKHLQRGRIDEAEREMHVIEDAARELYADVRGVVLELRDPSTHAEGLIPRLEAQLVRFGAMTGTPATIDANDAARALRLPAGIEVQVLRIVLEALSNVRKHAEAQQVTVELRVVEDELRLVVLDNGNGFAPRPDANGVRTRLGLQTMRERAASVGAELELGSIPGHGTRVTLRLPLRQASEGAYASLAGR